VIGGPGAWDNAQRAKMQCPKTGCDGEEAAFFMVQIRSADEPMTGFYKVSFFLTQMGWMGRWGEGKERRDESGRGKGKEGSE
jgi:Transcription factor S-II (TFIIS)